MSRQREAAKKSSCRNPGFFVLIMLMALLLPGCSSGSEDTSSHTGKPIVSRLNKQHDIIVEFYGKLIGPDSEPAEYLLVDHILVRDNKTNEVERFIPEDADTLQSSFGYFTDVWSPDGAYLVLPLGRFQGFALFSSKTVMEDLRLNRLSEAIQIGLATDNPPKLWHEFIGWKKPHSIHFSAGLSGRTVEFVFDPGIGEVHTRNAAGDSFKATTKSGITEVSISNDM